MVSPASCPNSMMVTMGNCRHKVKVLDIPLSWGGGGGGGGVTSDWCIKTKEIILNSKRNAYFAYLVQCINWGLNTDLMVCKISLRY